MLAPLSVDGVTTGATEPSFPGSIALLTPNMAQAGLDRTEPSQFHSHNRASLPRPAAMKIDGDPQQWAYNPSDQAAAAADSTWHEQNAIPVSNSTRFRDESQPCFYNGPGFRSAFPSSMSDQFAFSISRSQPITPHPKLERGRCLPIASLPHPPMAHPYFEDHGAYSGMDNSDAQRLWPYI